MTSTSQPTAVIGIERHALGTLQFIRETIESASGFEVPGSAGVIMGVIGLSASALCALGADFLMVWLLAAMLAVVAGGACVWRQGGDSRRALYRASLRRFTLCLCPTLLAGAVLTTVFVAIGQRHFLPGTWLLLYGCAVLSASTLITRAASRAIALMAGIFLASGVLTLLLPASVHNLMLGAGFGGLHLGFGLLLAESDNGR